MKTIVDRIELTATRTLDSKLKKYISEVPRDSSRAARVLGSGF